MNPRVASILLAVAVVLVWKVSHWWQKPADPFAAMQKEIDALGQNVDEILKHEGTTQPEYLVMALLGICDRQATAHGDDSLTPGERKLVNVIAVQSEVVDNGGFDQYFYNESGDEAPAALAALRDMDAPDAADLLQRALAVFPEGKPPADQKQRHAVMKQIAKDSKMVWDDCDQKFYALKDKAIYLPIIAYAKKHREEFVVK